ncbi:MAG: HipA domain-containing protein [Actinobacteria bacterium]|nr:HipA domain-containing protein [Actinomycetota bacterium]
MARPGPELEVLLADEHVAVLRSARNGLELAYLPNTVGRLGVGAVCLSMALPVDRKPFTGARVERWTEALLPEGEARTVLEDRFGVRRGDSFGLLAKIGRDCAGAVCFVAEVDHARAAALEPISLGELEQQIADLPIHPLGADEEVPVSLAGLQRKLLLVRTADGGWARPLHGQPSSHILKPDPFERPGLIAAEALVMTAAKIAGLDVAEVVLDHIGGRDVLVVERFDRRIENGRLVRTHQEDGCQALGLDPSRDNKYERPVHRDNPSYGRFARVLLDHAVDPHREQVKLAQAMVLHIAAGNTDAHARNHGFLLEQGTARLAPIYDASPTIEFSNTRRCALTVCGQDQLEQVTAEHLMLEARSWSPLRDDGRAIVTQTAALLASAFDEASKAVPQVPRHIVERMCERAARVAT